MEKTIMTDAALRQAAASVRRAMLSAVPPPEECRHDFSPEFEEKMERLFRAERRRGRFRSVARGAAAILLAVLIGAGVWLASDSRARASFVNWVREVYETYVVYRFTGEAPAETLPEYRLGWLPEGYVEVSVSEKDGVRSVVYGDTEGVGQDIVLVYFYLRESAEQYVFQIRREAAVSVNGAQGYFYCNAEDPASSLLAWIDDAGETVFLLSAELPDEVILYMAESLCLADVTK